ncbi:uncharacterized protein LACBIDRAFT_332159 [Laccaria bicolor S238N-H82]|uniref:Predicted protein n=1 Tax=Laccaria bicolor (strain S238N-H82 / ATCC MYA-4686) TaxID=486041 RepID=B0DRS9_LACBS|nr:uncharacterized protein LACBIDRAFT_332159 [Laccaria bicolor S238N-H82]EDR02662.1 predicted protein [Laccaria bicolor S238N-H82]|eukprot:XP_001886706.1 predicted protein [Laccaria bicolor S238N-H82]
MAQPQLYHSANAKRDANRAKSTCSYQSHKSEIQARWQKKRQTQNLSIETLATDASPSSPSGTTSIRQVRISSDPEYWTTQADSCHTKYRMYIKGCCKSFVEAAARDYLRTTKTKLLSKEITILKEFRSHFKCYEDELLHLEGVSENWREVHKMTLEVRETICWLEQLLCDALLGILVFQAAYLANGYAYQMS